MKCKNKIKTIYKKKKRIIVIGDLHGDYDAFVKCLIMSKLIDKNKNWIGNDSVLVQMGDQLDSKRGEINTKDNNNRFSFFNINKLLKKLDKQSKLENGLVISLIGNHEIMNIMGNYKYVGNKQFDDTSDYLSDVGIETNNSNILDDRDTLFNNSKFIKNMACNRNIVVKIGSWIFVHAGLVYNIVENYDLEKINEIARSWILGIDIEEIHKNNILFSPKYSPTWYRGYGKNVNCKMLDKALNIIKAKNMVVGHSVQSKYINSVCNNKLWRVDTGLWFRETEEIAEPIQILEILNDGKEVNIYKYKEYLYLQKILRYLEKNKFLKLVKNDIIPTTENKSDILIKNNKIIIRNPEFNYLNKYIIKKID
jgi:hypothetical protein